MSPAGGTVRSLGIAGGLLLTALVPAPAEVPEVPPVENSAAADTAATAIGAELEVERTLLAETLERFRELGGRRTAVHDRLGTLYAELDRRVVSSSEDALGPALEALTRDIETAEAERQRLAQAERSLVEHILQQSRRVALLEQRLAEIEGRLAAQEAGTLTGEWEVTMLPVEQRGTLSLRQSGTLVSGTYRLSGGFSGSLQGTLVSRKVYLVRIDSKLGKSMELEGYLSADGKSLRGTWLGYELAGSAGSSGHWAATKR